MRRFFIDLLQLSGIPLWVKQYFVIKLAENILPLYKKNDRDAISAETERFTDIDYIVDYANLLMGVEGDEHIKYNFLFKCYNFMGGAFEPGLMKYHETLKKLNNTDIDEICKICNEFDEKIYPDLEPVFENLNVLNLFSYFLSNSERGMDIYEIVSTIFINSSLTKMMMAIYYHDNGKNISRQEEIEIISIMSRKLMHSFHRISEFCKEQEKKGFLVTGCIYSIIR